MGVDICLCTKEKIEEEDRIFPLLSRDFISLVDGRILVGENNELAQIETLLNIDLSLLQERAEMQPDFGELELDWALAELAKDSEKIAAVEGKMKIIEEEWESKHDERTKGWIEIDKLRNLVQLFLSKINETPNYYKHLRLNYYNWEDYFFPKDIVDATDPFRLTQYGGRRILIDDLEAILLYLDKVETLGCKLVTFMYC